jgi:hypothetical protein
MAVFPESEGWIPVAGGQVSGYEWRSMKKASLLGFCAASLAAIALSPTVFAEKEAVWINMFDGKSLAGWKSSTDSPESFSVVDGELKLSGNRAHLFYVGPDGTADFTNFEVKLKVKTTPNANSGVYIHTKYQENGWPNFGYECQVNSSQKDPKKTGSLYAVMNVYVDPPDNTGTEDFEPHLIFNKHGSCMRFPNSLSTDGEWFDYHIVVQGKRIILKVNGRTTVDFTEPEGWQGAGPGMPGRKLSSGTIALQAHDPGSTVFYKDLKIRPLPAPAP